MKWVMEPSGGDSWYFNLQLHNLSDLETLDFCVVNNQLINPFFKLIYELLFAGVSYLFHFA